MQCNCMFLCIIVVLVNKIIVHVIQGISITVNDVLLFCVEELQQKASQALDIFATFYPLEHAPMQLIQLQFILFDKEERSYLSGGKKMYVVF